ncbi:TPA: hypothetical protein NKT41_004527 [Vibrio parahaemolyticus]|nr:hypothetical protein [Vibrio parahaemolyticus]
MSDKNHNLPESLSIARVTFNKLYFKNKDGSKREDVGVYKIGVGSPRGQLSSEQLNLVLSVAGKDRDDDRDLNLNIIINEDGIRLFSDDKNKFISLIDIIRFVQS